MESPWKILNLDPQSASEKEVKVAYARLIKVHRPDADPAGFQRIREAYEIGLAMIKERGPATPPAPPPPEDAATADSSGAPAPPEPTEAAAPAEPLPASLIAAEETVARARAAGDQDATYKAISSLFYVCRAIHPGRAGVRLWQESLHRVTEGSSELVAHGLTASQLVAELEAGYSILCHACLGHWEATYDLAAIRHFGETILMESRRVDPDEAAIVALRVALETGFVMPALALRLVHFAFPHLQRDARDHYVPQVDQQIQLGTPFEGLREDQLEFWHRRFRRPQAEVSWSTPPSEAALEYLSTARGPAWEGYDFLPKIAPPEWMDRLQLVMRRKHGGLFGRFRPMVLGTSHNDRPARPAWQRPARVVLMFLGGALGLLQLISLLVTTFDSFHGKIKSKPAAATDPVPVQSNWSSVPLPEPAKTLKSIPDYAAGRAQRSTRLNELRAIPRVSSWRDMAVTMHQNGADPAWTGGGPSSRKEMDFRDDIQRFFKGIADSDPAVEPPVLELLLLDSLTPHLLREEAMRRQVSVLPVSTLIAVWKQAAAASSAESQMMADAARWYLKYHGQDLSVGPEERREFEMMIRNSGTPAGR